MAVHTMTIRNIVTLDGNNNIVDKTVEYSSTMPLLIDGEEVAGSATTALTIAIDISALKSIVFLCTVACTIKTNSADTPDDTIVLPANLPYIWHTTDLNTKLLTADVTSLHIVVAGATAGLFTVGGIVDPTP